MPKPPPPPAGPSTDPATDALRRTEARRAAMLDAALDAVITIDEHGHILEFNRAAEQTFGHSAADVIGKVMGDLIVPPDLRAAHQAGLARFRSTGEGRVLGRRIEMRAMRADGSQFPCELAITKIAGGGPQVFTGYIRDITERQHGARAMADAVEQLRLITDALPVLISYVDRQRRYQFNNIAYEKWFGRQRAEVRGKLLAEVLGQEAFATVRPYVDAALAGREVHYEAEIPYVRGGTRWIEATYVPHVLDDGTVAGFVALIADISDRRRMEHERRTLLAQEQSARAVAEAAKQQAEELTEQLTGALQTRDTFLSIASHELRTPITTLRMQTQLILSNVSRGRLDALTPERLVPKLEVIERQCERLERLVSELLNVTLIAAGRLDVNLEPVDLAQLVREVADGFIHQAERAGCALRVKADGSVPGVWDRMRLEHVITNLLSNAIKYGAGKPVEITAAAVHGVAVLSVRDEGIGIAAQDIHRIFGRFERIVSEQHYGGFGLGLWIARQMVEALGGRISVESQQGAGSTFTVELPMKA